MSLNAFYQTLYQGDQLFRFADDWSEAVPVASSLLPTVAVMLVDTLPPVVLPADEPEQVLPAYVPPPPLPQPPTTAALEIVKPVSESTPMPAVPGLSQRPATPLISQKMLILVDEELLPSDVLFLEKILKAVNLDVNGVDLLNIHGLQGMDFGPVLAGKAVHHFFTFGVPFQKINLDIMMDRYHPIRFDGVTFMMADSLATIEADKNLKRRLWEALQKVFLWR